MTDEQLAVELCPDNPCLGLICVATFTPAKRAAMVGLIEVADELNLWTAGLGPKPSGVIACGPKQIRRA